MFKINVMTQLLVFFMLAVSINFLNLKTLIVLFTILLVILLINGMDGFLRATMRFKWFFLAMLLIFAFNTPGEHVSPWPFMLSPSYEGISAGLTQILRIVLMLAALNLILACNTRQELISGFYFIFSPFKFFGIKVERFVVRLWLTLHYVEFQSEPNHKRDVISQLKNMTDIKADHTDEHVSITFAIPSFNFADYAAITSVITASLFLIYNWA